VTFAYVFDAGPFRVRKYDSVVIGLGTSVEVVKSMGARSSDFRIT